MKLNSFPVVSVNSSLILSVCSSLLFINRKHLVILDVIVRKYQVYF